jgi:hypothetical protein
MRPVCGVTTVAIRSVRHTLGVPPNATSANSRRWRCPTARLFEAAVIHHTQCGTGALVDDTFRRRYAERIAPTSRPCAGMPSSTRGDRHPRGRAPRVSPRNRSARQGVRACLYEVLTGLIETIIPADH